MNKKVYLKYINDKNYIVTKIYVNVYNSLRYSIFPISLGIVVN